MQKKIAAEEYYQELDRVGGPDLVAFARWVVDNAPAHGLNVEWGSAGPLLKFAHEKHPHLPFTIGQLNKSGVLSQRQTAILRRCEELHIPTEVIRDYLKAVAALIPGACVKTFPLPGGDVKELLVAGEDAGPAGWPALAPLVLHKEEWFAVIDRMIARIRTVLDGPASNKGPTGKPLPKV